METRREHKRERDAREDRREGRPREIPDASQSQSRSSSDSLSLRGSVTSPRDLVDLRNLLPQIRQNGSRTSALMNSALTSERATLPSRRRRRLALHYWCGRIEIVTGAFDPRLRRSVRLGRTGDSRLRGLAWLLHTDNLMNVHSPSPGSDAGRRERTLVTPTGADVEEQSAS